MSLENPEFLLLTRTLKSELLWITIYFSFFNVYFESIHQNDESLNYVSKMEIQNFNSVRLCFSTMKPQSLTCMPQYYFNENIRL